MAPPPDQTPALLRLEIGSADLDRQVLSTRGGEVRLSPMEASLLRYMAAHPWEVLSVSALLTEVWGYSERVQSRTVYSTMSRLRKKMERDPERPRHLLTLPRQGYRFEPLPDPDAAAPDPARLRPGDLPVSFGRYVLQSILGQGGMGRVFRADLQGPAGFRKTVALKVVRPPGGGGSGRGDLTNEARLGGLLRHPNVVDIYEFGELDGCLFIAMELVEGLSLAQLLERRGALSPRAALELGLQVCAGLAHAHTLRVGSAPADLVHRDLKPANLLLGWDGYVKVADLGLARATGVTSTRTDAVPGTPAYMSPEQAAGGVLDGRSDLFSLGAVLYEAITGRRLFAGGTLAEVWAAIRDVERRVAAREFQAELDAALPGLAPVLQRALRRNPERRYQRCQDLAAALRGLLPEAGGAPLRDILEEVRGAAPEAESTRRSRASAASGRTNLRGERDSFIGRAAELAWLAEQLQGDARLVSLLGPGGVGKTRLAQHYGRVALARWPGGVWFCDLSEARTALGCLHAVGRALGVRGADDADSLGRALDSREGCLLILDNLEQVAEDAAPLVSAWLDAAPSARLLVTSRSPLGLSGERRLTLGPLALPADGAAPSAAASAEAVQLFQDRAREILPGFAVEAGDIGDVVELVRQLDGLPLAIELAASRAGLLSPGEIRERLGRRFSLLRAPRRDSTDRHRALRAAIDWSWELLTAWEQDALAQCSIFEGGFTLEAAEAVIDLSGHPEAPWVLDVLSALLEHSLLHVTEIGGLRRFNLYRSIRAYAAEALAGPRAAAAARRHGRYYARMGDQRFLDALDSRRGKGRRRLLSLEIDNLLAACARAAEDGRADDAAGAALAALTALELRRGPGPVADLLDRVLSMPALSPALRVRLLRARAWAAMSEGRWPVAREALEEAKRGARALGDRRGEGRILLTLGSLGLRSGDLEGAAEALEAALALGGDDRIARQARGDLAAVRATQGRAEEALTLYRAALARHRAAGDLHLQGQTLSNLGALHLGLDQVEQADACLREALALHERVGNPLWIGITRGNLGELRLRCGELEEAAAQLTAAVAAAEAQGADGPRGAFMSALAEARALQGALGEARRLVAQGEALLRGAGEPVELARLLCRRGLIALWSGERAAAEAALAAAAEAVEGLEITGGSELERSLARLRELLRR